MIFNSEHKILAASTWSKKHTILPRYIVHTSEAQNIVINKARYIYTIIQTYANGLYWWAKESIFKHDKVKGAYF